MLAPAARSTRSAGGQRCCQSDCTNVRGATVCLSNADGQCNDDVNCAWCSYDLDSQCDRACVDGVCQVEVLPAPALVAPVRWLLSQACRSHVTLKHGRVGGKEW